MNRKIFLSAALAALVLQPVSAIPADPHPKKVRQPDGSYITVVMRGDEHAHLTFSADGTPLFFNRRSGAFEYASLAGGQIAGSGIVARDAADRDARAKAYVSKMDVDGIKRAVLAAPSLTVKAASRRTAATASRQPGASRIRINDFPTKGRQKSLVILWEFSDQGFTSVSDPKAFFNGLLNEPGFTWEGTGINGSARDFYLASSMNQFDPDFVVYGPVKLSHTATYYGSDTPTQDAKIYEAIIESCKALDDEIDFSEYDTDGDGKVDNIYFFYAGNGQADTPNGSDYIWPHSYYLGADGWKHEITLDGVKIDRYTCSNELRYRADGSLVPTGIGTFVHEFGHVLGLADHYDTSYGMLTFGLGSWDTMASGSYNNDMNTPPLFSAFERAELGWLDYDELTTSADTISVLPKLADSNRAYRVSVDGTEDREFYVMENRRREGWDKYLPGEGMLMWHIDIDTLAWNNNAVNVQPGHQRIDIVEADGVATDATRSGDTFPGSAGVTQWTLKSWAGDSLMKIDDVTDRDGNIRLLLAGTKYRLPAPEKVSVANVQDSSFVATWDAVADAKAYVVSAYRTTADGRREYVGGLNRKVYAKVADVTVDGLLPDCDYSFDVAAQLASYTSGTVTAQTRTLPLAFAKRMPTGLAADDVAADGFAAHWDEVPTADDYLLTLYRHAYSDTTVGQGYDFADKYNGLPSLWSTSSQNYYSVKGYYGNAAPSLRLSKTGDYLIVAYPDAKIDGVAFWARSSKTGNRIVVETADGSGDDSWTEAETLDVPTAAATLSVSLDGAKRVRLRLEQTAGYVVVDDVEATCRQVERRVVDGFSGLSTDGKTEYEFGGLEPGETYGFRVQAVSSGELSCVSPECTVTLPSTTGVGGVVSTENALEKQYYDVTGARVNRPQNGGLYIVRQGGKTYKKMMK